MYSPFETSLEMNCLKRQFRDTELPCSRDWDTIEWDSHVDPGEATCSSAGIMDYGDCKLGGVYQFNTRYRRQEMCQQMNSVTRLHIFAHAFCLRISRKHLILGQGCESMLWKVTCPFQEWLSFGRAKRSSRCVLFVK